MSHHPDRQIVLPFLSLLLLPLLLLPGAVRGADWSDFETRFRAAFLARDVTTLSALVDEVRGEDHPKACELLIRYTPFGADYDLERKVGAALTRMENPRGRDVIYRALRKHPAYEARIVLAAVAYHLREDPEAFAALLRALEDPRREVVFATLLWLRKAGDQRAVEALIDLLEREERGSRGRLYYDALRTLEGLTNARLELAADWRNYWSIRKGSPEPEKVDAGKHRTVVARPASSFFSVMLNSDSIAFVIDVSGSMDRKDPPVARRTPPPPRRSNGPRGRTEVGPEAEPPRRSPRATGDVDQADLPDERMRITRVKNELIRSVKSLDPSVRFTILAFNHQVHFLDEESPGLVPATAGNKKRAVEWVELLAPSGETWTDTAFERLYSDVENFDTVIFLSDGAPRRDHAAIPPDEVLAGVKTLNRFKKCRIHTIGFLQAGGPLQHFLERLAEQSDATYTSLE